MTPNRREAAERWLAQHRYRIRELLTPTFGGPSFAPSLGRDTDNAFDFRAVVDDLRLGGTGTVWIRVYANWLAEAHDDVEVQWEKMPDGGASSSRPAPEEQWADAQAALLHRVTGGENVFRPDARDPDGGANFDELVEHLMALQRRGLVTCGTPLANVRGPAQYAAVTDVALTPAGEREAERLRALQTRAPGAAGERGA